MSKKTAKGQPPVKKFTVGRIHVSIWRKEGEKGVFHTANFDRRYKDGEEWKSSGSFGVDDLDDLREAAEMARSSIHLLDKGEERRAAEDAEDEAA